MRRATIPLWLGLAIQLVTSMAHGQGQAADQALANDLFQRGRKALLEERYAEACPFLEESQRLDPAGGTLLNLALCHENLGRTATAWTEFHDALAIARHERRADRVDFALAHIAALEGRLSRLIIEVTASDQSPGLVIERDGTALGTSVWGKPMPVDPGEHRVRATAPGREPFLQVVQLGASGDTLTVVVPVLEASSAAPAQPALPDAPVVSTEAPAVAEQVAPPSPPPPPPVAPTAPSLWRKRLAISLFAIAAAGVVSAVATGVRAFRLRDEAEEHCEGGLCYPSAFPLNDRARRNANASTALTVISAVSGGVGIYFWFAQQSANPQPAIARSLGLGYARAF
jgi:tetratricopeptide (TPR) repeat protein